MRIPMAVVLAGLLAAVPSAVLAQDGAGAPPPVQPRQQAPGRIDRAVNPPAQDPLPTPAELGLSLSHIRRDLRESPPTKSALLRYDFHVNVYGSNPKIDFFKDFDLSPDGPVRYGGMTHAEFMNIVTPQAFRAPSGDLLSVAMLAIQQLMNRGSGGSNK